MGGVTRVLRRILQLQDVNAGSIADGETLVWDAAAEEFIPGAGGGGGGGAPSGPAGGVLGGTYPNPAFAADMATQAEADAIAAGAVILAPASSARNVIQPTAGAVIAAVVKAHAAQSVDLTQWQTSAAAVIARLGLSGRLTLSPSALIGSNRFDGILHILNPVVGNASGSHLYAGVWSVSDDGNFSEPTTGAKTDLAAYVTQNSGTGQRSAGMNFYSRRGSDKRVYAASQYDGFATLIQWLLDETTLAPVSEFDLGPGLGGQIMWGFPAGYQIVVYEDYDGTTPKYQFTNVAGTFKFGIFGAAAASVAQQSASSVGALWTALKAYGWLTSGSAAPTVYEAGGTDVPVADGGTGASTAAAARTNLDVPSTSEAVLDSLFDANTVLAADADNTPAALTMGASTILARLAAGNIKAATPAELRTLLDVPTNAEAILDAIVDAKGDLIAATAADTVTRVAVGANGTVLTADSTAAAGVAWAATAAGASYSDNLFLSRYVCKR